MKKISREVKIGVAFIVALFLLYYGISFLKGINIFKPANTYMVVFDNVDGLTKSAPVSLHGFQVGVVSAMEIDKKNPNRVIAYLMMNKGVEITKGSKVSIESSMLSGGKLVLEMNPYSKDICSSNDTIIGTKKKGLMDAADALAPQLETILPKIDSILTGIQLLVTNPALEQTLVNVNQITSDLAQSSKQLTAITASLSKEVPTIAGNLKTVSDDVSGLTGQLKQLNIVSTFNSIDSTAKNIEQLSSKLNDKNSSIGLLLNNRQLYDSINSAVGNASSLLKDVKDQPQRYINIKVF